MLNLSRFLVVSSSAISSASNAVFSFGLVRNEPIASAANLTTYLSVFLAGLSLARAGTQFSLIHLGSQDELATDGRLHRARLIESRLEMALGHAWLYLLCFVLSCVIAVLLNAFTGFKFNWAVLAIVVGALLASVQDSIRIASMSVGRTGIAALMDTLWFVIVVIGLPFMFTGVLSGGEWIALWLLGAAASLVLGLAMLKYRPRMRMLLPLVWAQKRVIRRGLISPFTTFLLAPAVSVAFVYFFTDAELVGWRAANLMVFPLAIMLAAIPGFFLSENARTSGVSRGIATLVLVLCGITVITLLVVVEFVPGQWLIDVIGPSAPEATKLVPATIGIQVAGVLLAFLTALLLSRGELLVAALASSLQQVAAFAFFTGAAFLGCSAALASWWSVPGALLGFGGFILAMLLSSRLRPSAFHLH